MWAKERADKKRCFWKGAASSKPKRKVLPRNRLTLVVDANDLSFVCIYVCVCETNQRIHNKSGWFDGWIHTVGQKYSAEASLAAVLASHHHISFQIVVEMKICNQEAVKKKKPHPLTHSLSLSLYPSTSTDIRISSIFSVLSIETESKWFIQVFFLLHPFAFSHRRRLRRSKTSVYIHTNTNSLVQTLAFALHLAFAHGFFYPPRRKSLCKRIRLICRCIHTFWQDEKREILLNKNWYSDSILESNSQTLFVRLPFSLFTFLHHHCTVSRSLVSFACAIVGVVSAQWFIAFLLFVSDNVEDAATSSSSSTVTVTHETRLAAAAAAARYTHIFQSNSWKYFNWFRNYFNEATEQKKNEHQTAVEMRIRTRFGNMGSISFDLLFSFRLFYLLYFASHLIFFFSSVLDSAELHFRNRVDGNQGRYRHFKLCH